VRRWATSDVAWPAFRWRRGGRAVRGVLYAECLAEDSALGCGDGLTVESANLVGGTGAETSQDAAGQHRREVADRRVVVQLGFHDEPTVLRSQCGSVCRARSAATNRAVRSPGSPALVGRAGAWLMPDSLVWAPAR
jgi:hypothetical protein